MSQDKLITLHAAAKILHISPTTLGAWLREGKIPGYRVPGSRKWLLKKGEVLASLQANVHTQKFPENLEPDQANLYAPATLPNALFNAPSLFELNGGQSVDYAAIPALYKPAGVSYAGDGWPILLGEGRKRFWTCDQAKVQEWTKANKAKALEHGFIIRHKGAKAALECGGVSIITLNKEVIGLAKNLAEYVLNNV